MEDLTMTVIALCVAGVLAITLGAVMLAVDAIRFIRRNRDRLKAFDRWNGDQQ